jgi:hypothetical protein
MRVRGLVGCAVTAALSFCLIGSPPLMETATAGVQVQSLHVTQPSRICGYSGHAREQMARRGITEFDVELAVALADPFLNNKGNWQFDNGGMSAVLNDAGCVVTVMLR